MAEPECIGCQWLYHVYPIIKHPYYEKTLSILFFTSLFTWLFTALYLIVLKKYLAKTSIPSHLLKIFDKFVLIMFALSVVCFLGAPNNSTQYMALRFTKIGNYEYQKNNYLKACECFNDSLYLDPYGRFRNKNLENIKRTPNCKISDPSRVFQKEKHETKNR